MKNYSIFNVISGRYGDLGHSPANVVSNASELGLFFNISREEALAYCEKEGLDPKKQLIYKERTLYFGRSTGERADFAELLVKPNGLLAYGNRNLATIGTALPCGNTLPIHDHFESWERYNECAD